MERKRAAKKAAGISTKATRELGIKPYDVADYLNTEAKRAAYFNEVVSQSAPGDIAAIKKALGDIARSYGMVRLAKEAGITRQGLHKALGESGDPSLTNTLKVMSALGLRVTAKAA